MYTKRELKKMIKAVFPEAKVKWYYDLAIVANWREIEGGKYNKRYTGKADFYQKLRENDLVDLVTIGE